MSARFLNRITSENNVLKASTVKRLQKALY